MHQTLVAGIQGMRDKISLSLGFFKIWLKTGRHKSNWSLLKIVLNNNEQPTTQFSWDQRMEKMNVRVANKECYPVISGKSVAQENIKVFIIEQH